MKLSSRRVLGCGLFAALAVCGSASAQLYDNGPLSTGNTAERGTTAPAGFTWSELQHNAGNNAEANTVLGFGASAGTQRLADDFVVPPGERWTLNGLLHYVYRSNHTDTMSPVTGSTLRIWRGAPNDPSSVVIFGDTTTNRMPAMNGSVATTMYRIVNSVVPPPGITPNTSRRLWETTVTISPPLQLGPGVYWVDYDTTAIGTHFHSSVTIPFNRGDSPLMGWNAMQLSVASGTWSPVLDQGIPALSAPDAPQDLPFKLLGQVESAVTGACCLSSGGCAAALTVVECSNQGGAYQGDDSTCEACLGACCFADGSCESLSPPQCASRNGLHQGPATPCGDITYSVMPIGAVFEDISGLGDEVIIDSGNPDDGSGEVMLPFGFVFFGQHYPTNQIRVRASTNGYITFTANPDDGRVTSNRPIPSFTAPNNLIAVLWDDLTLNNSPAIRALTDGITPNRRCIIQWTNVPLYQTLNSSNSFQVVLFESSNIIEFRYGVVDSTPPLNSVRGLENRRGTDGIAITDAPISNTAFRFIPSGYECDQPTSVCCLLDASCEIRTALDCALSSAIWRDDTQDCFTAGCTTAGACCQPNGACAIRTVSDCNALSGFYQGDGVLCDPNNPCLGQCCFGDAGCQVVTINACVEQGGTFMGSGTTCTPNTCGGACCTADGNCQFVTSTECDNISGQYSGDGEECGENSCRGGCCTPDGSCQIVSNQVCAMLDGRFNGFGTNCGVYTIVSSPNEFTDTRPSGSILFGEGQLPQQGDLDDGSSLVPLPFAFTFFGVIHSSVRVSTNGYLNFTSNPAEAAIATNLDIPNVDAPNNIICPAWDDCDLRSSGTVHTRLVTQSGNEQFIVQWTNVDLFSVPGTSLTFQVVLHEGTNLIEFRYSDMTSQPPASRTIGVENNDGTMGASVSGDVIGVGGSGTSLYVVPFEPCAPVTMGACCLPNGCGVFTFQQCLISGGSYRGDDVTCDDTECELPTVFCPGGDLNLDGEALDGDDLQLIVEVLTGADTDSTHVCQVDVNANETLDGGDLDRLVRHALQAGGGAQVPFNVRGHSCGSAEYVIATTGAAGKDVVVNAFKDGFASDCRIYVRRRLLGGAPIGTKCSIDPGQSARITMGPGEELRVRGSAAGGLVRASYLPKPGPASPSDPLCP